MNFKTVFVFSFLSQSLLALNMSFNSRTGEFPMGSVEVESIQLTSRNNLIVSGQGKACVLDINRGQVDGMINSAYYNILRNLQADQRLLNHSIECMVLPTRIPSYLDEQISSNLRV